MIGGDPGIGRRQGAAEDGGPAGARRPAGGRGPALDGREPAADGRGPALDGRGGPDVVAVGGGHGQAVTLRAARRYAGRVTGVVSVADDGGSSGRLRRELGIVPPGDIRTCLVALAAEGSVLARAFEHRFPAVVGEGAAGGCRCAPAADGGGAPASGTSADGADVGHGAAADGTSVSAGDHRGHALGNLVLAGLLAVTGDLQVAVDEAAALLGAVGRVVPATDRPVVLVADAEGGQVAGQTAVMRTARIRRVSLEPTHPVASPEAVAAIERADQVVLGPGSLYTSVLAAAAVPAVAEAVRATAAQRVYVANLRPQPAETAGYDVGDHVAALAAHGIPVDVVLCDTTAIALGQVTVPVVDRRLAKANGLAHDDGRLATALADLLGWKPLVDGTEVP